jgi:hypothetical protein
MTGLIITRVVIPFMFFAVGMDMVRLPVTKDNVDSKNFALAMVFTSCWFASQWLAFFSASFCPGRISQMEFKHPANVRTKGLASSDF